MKNLCKAALLLLLCAGSAAALGKGQIPAHTHDTAVRGGSTLRPAVLSMTAASSATFSGAFSLVDSSSQTIIPAGTTTVGTCNVCRATVTLVNYGNFDMAVEHLGTVQGGGAGNEIAGFYLINGGYYNGQGALKAAFVEETGTSNGSRTANWKDIVPKAVIPSTGTISVCFGYATNSGTTATFPSTFGTITAVNNKFRVSFPISK